MKTAAIVNPNAGKGRAARRWLRIREQMSEWLGAFESSLTARPGHAETLARQFLKQGFERIVAVGGDGTIHEVVNGFVEDGRLVRPEACFGVVPLGAANDFARSLGVAPDQIPLPIDVGKVIYPNGHRYFVNVLSIGLGGEVALRMRRSRFGGYLFAVAVSLLRRHHTPVQLNSETFNVTHVAIGNGRYQGSGMQVCPGARLDDGVLEITVVERLGLIELLRDLRVLYSGEIYSHAKVRHLRAERIRAVSPELVLLETDGEPAGTLPVEIEVLPRALRVICPGPSNPR